MDFTKINGFILNKKNQIKFYNKVLNGKVIWRRDGVDTLRHTELSDNIMKYDIGNNKTVNGIIFVLNYEKQKTNSRVYV